jgi:hypothetical protein
MPYKNKADRDRHNKEAYVKYKAAGYYQMPKYQDYQNRYKRFLGRLDKINTLEGIEFENTKTKFLRETASPDSVLGEFFAKTKEEA